MPLVLAEFVWRPIASPLHIIGSAVLLAALAVFAYVRADNASRIARASLLLMRLAVIGTMAVFLFGPSGKTPERTSLDRPRLEILLDTSESMQVNDCQEESRIGFIKRQWLGDERLRELEREFEVTLTAFDEGLRALPQHALQESDEKLAAGRETRLAESVTQIVSRVPSRDDGSALLVISDGHDSAEAPLQGAASLAAGKRLPVHAVAVGGASSRPDIAVLAVPTQEYLLPNEAGAILAKVHQTGFGEASVMLRLRHGAAKHETPIAFQGQSVVEVKLPVQQDQPGQFEYAVEVDVLANETEPANNRQQVFIDVREKRLKALVLEGQPFWDSKFLAQSLRKDQRLEITHITQISANKRETIVTRGEQSVAVVPDTEAAWASYDLVILGQGLEHVLDEKAAEQLVRYVSQGGSLILSRGRPYADKSAPGPRLSRQLAPVEPVTWGAASLRDHSLRLTPAGTASQWFAPTKMGVDVEAALSRLPGFAAMTEVRRPKPGTIVLAEAAPAGSAGGGERQPAIVTMRYGRGSVAAILGEGLWRWSLLSPEEHDLVGFYDTFWSNLVRWMLEGGDFQPGDQVALSLSRTSVRKGDSLHLDVAYKAASLTPNHRLEVGEPSGERREIALSRLPGPAPRYRAEYQPSQPGVYEAALFAPGANPSELRRKFSVYDLNLERFETAARPLPLRALAEQTGGIFFDPLDAADLIPQLRRQRLAALDPPQFEYLWDRGPVMIIFLVWAGMEWLLRRQAGLI